MSDMAVMLGSVSPTGYQRRQIIRLSKQGCRLWRIARDVGVAEYRVAEVLVANGLPLFERYEREAST